MNIYDILVKYIEENKSKYNIDYFETIDVIKEYIETIEKEYKELEERL